MLERGVHQRSGASALLKRVSGTELVMSEVDLSENVKSLWAKKKHPGIGRLCQGRTADREHPP